MSIAVIAKLTTQKGKESEFEKIFADLQKKVRANEKGCLYYDLCKSQEAPNVYYVMERYESKEALEVHQKSEYFAAAQKPMGGVLDLPASPPEITLLDHVS